MDKETIFRKVSVKERLPKKANTYFTIDGNGDIDHHYCDGEAFIIMGREDEVSHWLEELPPQSELTDEMIREKVNKILSLHLCYTNSIIAENEQVTSKLANLCKIIRDSHFRSSEKEKAREDEKEIQKMKNEILIGKLSLIVGVEKAMEIAQEVAKIDIAPKHKRN